MSGPRFGLIGARRVHQGLGPFIARDVAAAGGEVVAVLGRSPESAEAAASAAALRMEGDGPTPAATADVDEFFAHGLDAVCVLTPAGTHGDFVEAALAHGCHVLAEKPFLWYPETDWAARAADESSSRRRLCASDARCSSDSSKGGSHACAWTSS